MLKEIVNFSKELETSGIYERILESQRKIDKPIMVIPVKDDLSDFDLEKIHFVFKDVIEEECICILNGEKGDKRIQINPIENTDLKFSKLSEQSQAWKNILLNLTLYTKKPSNDAKGGKSIGSNKGTNSYSILVFEGKFKQGNIEIKNEVEKFKGDLFFCNEGFKQKIKDTYRKVNFTKGIPNDLDEEKKNKYSELFERFSKGEVLDKLWGKIEQFKNAFTVLDKKKKEDVIQVNSMFIVFKLPEKYYTIVNYYKDWYDKYLAKKVFKEEPPNKKLGYPKGNCPICHKKNIGLWVSNAFNNLDGGKLYLQHQHRYSKHKIDICGNCSLHLYKFQEFFLNKLRVTLFPLFIHSNNRSYVISLFKESDDLEKLTFKEIFNNIYQNTSQDELDFYLIVYKGDILSIDYITGFRYSLSGLNIFQIESTINRYFFGNKLVYNYFSQQIDTKREDINTLIYKYRQQFFDFFYRAKYMGINSYILQNLFLDVLRIQLKLNSSREDKIYITKSIKETLNKLLELDKIFKGGIMQTINRIKESGKIIDKESFAYFAGQITYYLLSQSKSDNKTHGLVEPFLNMSSYKVLGEKIEELFKTYKHAVSMHFPKFNEKFSELWSFLYDNRDEKFSKDLKILFYAGYFNSNENIFYKKEEE